MSFQSRKKRFESDQRVRYIIPRNNGEISNSITQNWTDQAIACYSSGFNCPECTIAQGNYSFVCQMPNVVKILLQELGPPDQQKIESLRAV